MEILFETNPVAGLPVFFEASNQWKKGPRDSTFTTPRILTLSHALNLSTLPKPGG